MFNLPSLLLTGHPPSEVVSGSSWRLPRFREHGTYTTQVPLVRCGSGSRGCEVTGVASDPQVCGRERQSEGAMGQSQRTRVKGLFD